MAAKDNQLIGSNETLNAHYIVDMDEWDTIASGKAIGRHKNKESPRKNEKALFERRKNRLAHERKKQCMWMMDE